MKLRLIDYALAIGLAFALAQPLWVPMVSGWRTVDALGDCGVVLNPIPVRLFQGL